MDARANKRCSLSYGSPANVRGNHPKLITLSTGTAQKQDGKHAQGAEAREANQFTANEASSDKKAGHFQRETQGLTPFDRYVFALLGHIFNDLMISQKLMHVSRVRPAESNEYVREAGVGLSLYLLRTLAARTKEVMETLRDKKISAHIEKHFFAPAGLETDWKDALNLFHKIDHDWLADVRNAHGFHYMRQHQFLPYLKCAYCDHAHVLVGQKYGDTFFTWSDIRAGHAMLDQVDPKDPFKGLDRMLTELGLLLGKLGDCIAQGLQRYLADQLMEPGALEEPHRVLAPDFDTFVLPYFYRSS